MDNGLTMQLLGGFMAGAGLAAVVVYAWVGRRLKLEQSRAVAGEQARQQLMLQVTQARKQIEQLQRECHELRLVVRPPRPAPAPAAQPDAAEAARLYAEARLAPAAPPARPDGFRDTVVLKRGE